MMAMLAESHDEEQIIARVAAPGHRQGGAGVLCAGAGTWGWSTAVAGRDDPLDDDEGVD